MQEMDIVQVIAEKEKYARDGVHKGMFGWICYPKCVEGHWLVNFPQCGDKEDIAEISMQEEDLRIVEILDAQMNEQIKAKFESDQSRTKTSANTQEDISGYLV